MITVSISYGFNEKGLYSSTVTWVGQQFPVIAGPAKAAEPCKDTGAFVRPSKGAKEGSLRSVTLV